MQVDGQIFSAESVGKTETIVQNNTETVLKRIHCQRIPANAKVSLWFYNILV